MPAATQVLRNSGESLRVSFYVDGVLTDPSGQAATVTITRDSGDANIATNAAATRISEGVYSYVLTPQADLDRLTAVWTGTFSGVSQSVTTYVDIVGGYYVSLAELRAQPNLSDQTKFPVAKLLEARQWFETKFERYTGRAFVPRYKRLVMWGSGCGVMQLPDEYIRTLRAVSYGTVVVSDAALANIAVEASGRIQYNWPSAINGPDETFGTYGSTFPTGTRITLAYEYGMDAAPDDVRDAAIQAIRLKLLEQNEGRREYATITDLGIIRYSKPGEGRPFGDEQVDQVANDRQRSGWKPDTMTVGSVPIA